MPGFLLFNVAGQSLERLVNSTTLGNRRPLQATSEENVHDGKILVTTGTAAPTELFASPNFPGPQAGAIARYNSNGSLDATFGVSGQASCVASAAAIAIQGNGKIVVAGTIPSVLQTLLESDGITVVNNQTGFGVVRYNANGSIDTTFNPGGGPGSGGGVITGFGNSFPQGSAFALALQSNGEIVVAGQAGNGTNGRFTASSFVLARYTTTGHLDTNFGSNGIVMTPIGQGNISFVSALVLQSDGKIVAAGNYAPPAGSDYTNSFAVARYLALSHEFQVIAGERADGGQELPRLQSSLWRLRQPTHGCARGKWSFCRLECRQPAGVRHLHGSRRSAPGAAFRR